LLPNVFNAINAFFQLAPPILFGLPGKGLRS
jgi:hypothetical protein